MSDYNRELHHEDHHETIERLQAVVQRLTFIARQWIERFPGMTVEVVGVYE